MRKKVLITGITGFVGSHLAEFILSQNLKVYGLKRWHHSKLNNIQHILPNIELFDCDLSDFGSVYKTITTIKPDLIFHLAAESFVSPSWDHPIHYMNVNYNGTVHVLEALRIGKLKSRILLSGSGEEYGEIEKKDLPITEKTILNPVNPYAVTKISQDLIGYVYYKSYGTQVIRTRAFNHEGPRRDNVFGISSYAYQIAKIEKGLQKPVVHTGLRDDVRNFTHVKDLVKAYYLAIEKCKPGDLYLIGSDEKNHIHTFDDALNVLISLSNYKGKIEKKIDPKLIRPTSVPRLIGDTSLFRKTTGWKPTLSFQTILEDTLNYWRESLASE